MPVLPRDMAGLLVRLDHEDLWVIRDQSRRRGVRMQLAKAAAECFVLFYRQLLVAKKEHQMVHERIVHLLELPVAKRPGQVDAEDLGADVRCRFAYFYALVTHALFPFPALLPPIPPLM